jgi:diacylglycerol O-acyltransferase / wax synthase
MVMGWRPGRRVGANGLDRLSPLDVANLRIEDHGPPMHVMALAILDGAPLCDHEGRLRLAAAQAEIERRLPRAPRLRQVVYRPRPGLGPPVWVDDAGFDIGAHVRARAVPSPGDEAALLAVCQELAQPALERSRPLWELWFLTGLGGGNVGMLIRLHHAVADGVATVALLGSLFDAAPDAPPVPAPPWIPHAVPSVPELLVDNLRRRGAALARSAAAFAHPTRWLRRLWAVVPLLGEYVGDGLAPRSSLNRPVGGRRRLLLVRGDLDRARAVAHAHGATVNDVMLAAVAGAVRALLRSRGELVPGAALRASVPVSIRRPRDPAAVGNLTGLMIVPLPVGEADPVRRLEAIVAATAARKRRPRPVQGPWRAAGPWLAWLLNHQRLVNLLVSNVPGPPAPLYFAGARVVEVFQVGVVQGNLGLGIGMLSYAGQLNFDLVGDADAFPDLAVLAEGLTDALKELGAVCSRPSRPHARGQEWVTGAAVDRSAWGWSATAWPGRPFTRR